MAKSYFYVHECRSILQAEESDYYNWWARKQSGNYFENKEEAELAMRLMQMILICAKEKATTPIGRWLRSLRSVWGG